MGTGGGIWYTRQLEVLVGAIPWRFKSSSVHHVKNRKCGFLHESLFLKLRRGVEQGWATGNLGSLIVEAGLRRRPLKPQGFKAQVELIRRCNVKVLFRAPRKKPQMRFFIDSHFFNIKNKTPFVYRVSKLWLHVAEVVARLRIEQFYWVTTFRASLEPRQSFWPRQIR